MKIFVPDYYKDFKCIADKCRHTCCKGWEVEIDSDSLKRFEKYKDIEDKIEHGDSDHFKLLEGEVCPFLLENGLCDMILKYGEDMLCQTCTDHPRFRNYFTDRIEMGLGMVCEEAARIILSRQSPMKLVELICKSDEDCQIDKEQEMSSDIEDCKINSWENAISDDSTLPEDEEWLLNLRNKMIDEVEGDGPIARLKEYLIYRHIPDALYDDRLEERIAFVNDMTEWVEDNWRSTDGSLEALIEIVRKFSYDVEYDEEAKELILNGYNGV